MNQIQTSPVGEILKRTTSRCVVCKSLVPGEVLKVPGVNGTGRIVLRRTCKDHGEQSVVISSDSRFYWLAQGSPLNSGCCVTPSSGGSSCCGGSNLLDEKKGAIDKLSTCLALIEIADSCNLRCPTCFADSPFGISANELKFYPLDNIKARINGVIARKGKIEIIQLSGGEPTIHPQFLELLEWLRQHEGIDYVLVNTNGVRIARDDHFLRGMSQLTNLYKKIQLYLQFDGPQEAGQRELRGADLRDVRVRAIERCGNIGLPITLAMTVTPLNIGNLWDTIRFGLKFDHVRGVSFQPFFNSGRSSVVSMDEPISVADIILGVNGQSLGKVSIEDFTPLPCGDPNCATIGWIFRMGGSTYSPAQVGVDIPALQAMFPDRVNYNLEDLKNCGCENSKLGELMKRLELKESNAFRLFVKPFMDARTWDEDRIDRCCTHVIRPDGKLDSFCRYYFGAPPGQEKKRIVL